MNNTADLIASLSAEVKASPKIARPTVWAVRLLVIYAAYALGAQLYLGFRPDLMVQLLRPLFALEIVLLWALLISSIIASVLSMYPDAYQKPQLLKLPYVVFCVLFLLMAFQLLMPVDPRMLLDHSVDAHSIECALCIASVAIIPSALIFALLRKGASVRPLQAGSFAVLAASAIGGLTLRLAEENDSIIHLVQWHYVPTLLFAALGALAGKWLLRW